MHLLDKQNYVIYLGVGGGGGGGVKLFKCILLKTSKMIFQWGK